MKRFLVCCLFLLAAALAVEGASSSAEEVVKAAGVKAGLLVHLADGSLAGALPKSGNLLTHVLSPDAETVAKVRAGLQAHDLYGTRVSVEQGSFAPLPYASNLANVIVVDDMAGASGKGLAPAEILRVLCPEGVLMAGKAGGDFEAKLEGAGFEDVAAVTAGGQKWLRARKPARKGVGDWGHWRGDAGGNPVSQDTIAGFPRQMQWVAEPRLTAGHKPATVAVSAGGRLYFTHDETRSLFDWARLAGIPGMSLAARDGCNGLLLWKKAISRIGTGMVAAHGDRLYTVVKRGGACVALDGTSGEEVRTYEGTEGTVGIRCLDGFLVLTVVKGRSWKTAVVEAAAGKILWEKPTSEKGGVRAGDGMVFTRNAHGVSCFELKTGREIWKRTDGAGVKGCAMVTYHGGILAMIEKPGRGECTLHALSAADGKPLWSRKMVAGNGYRTTQQLSFIGNVLYAKVSVQEKGKGTGWLVLDPKTGEEKGWIGGGNRGAGGGKCTTETACLGFFFKGGASVGIEGGGIRKDYGGFRTGCRPGTIPANGMMYYLPGDCTCSPFKGTFALVPESLATPDVPLEARLERGVTAPAATEPNEDDWPTFLHDNSRRCATKTVVPTDGRKLWTAGGCEGITPPVAASGTVFVGTRDHRVLAFDVNDGSEKWAFTAGGSVEYPPTHYRGMCLFGSCDGWVYCLDAGTGKLVWRLHAAPYQRKRIAFDRVESAWPVTTGVTIHEDTAYFFAGRLADFEGYYTVAADPRTGTILWEQRAGRTEATMLSEHEGFLNFCAFRGSSSATRIDPKKKKVETVKKKKAAHPPLFAIGPSAEVHGKMARWSLPGQPAPSAERLVLSGDSVFGAVWRRRGTRPELYRIDGLEKGKRMWAIEVPDMRTDAMILAGETLFLAGRAPGEEKDGCVLRAFSAADGKVLKSWGLAAPPVANGLAAARGRLYLTTTDGKIHCFGEQ